MLKNLETAYGVSYLSGVIEKRKSVKRKKLLSWEAEI
jgi:hypothetical protein